MLILTLLGMSACNNVKTVNPQITVSKVPDQTGGMYHIKGTGFDGNENVRLEIKNAPLKQPDNWQLGTAPASNGAFEFNTEDFRCTFVSDVDKRNQLGSQQVTFVAQGVTSHWSTSATSSAAQILICP